MTPVVKCRQNRLRRGAPMTTVLPGPRPVYSTGRPPFQTFTTEKPMRRTVACVLSLAAVILSLPALGQNDKKPKPVALFDGKTLDGWEGDTAKTWRVEDGAIAGGSLDTEVPRNEF